MSPEHIIEADGTMGGTCPGSLLPFYSFDEVMATLAKSLGIGACVMHSDGKPPTILASPDGPPEPPRLRGPVSRGPSLS